MSRRVIAASLLAIGTSGVCHAQAEKIELKLRLQKGQTYKLKVTEAQEIQQTVGGVPRNMSVDTAMAYTFDVEDVDPKGVATVKVTIAATAFRQSTPRGTVEYDSAKPPTTIPPAARSYAALVGLGFKMSISAEGDIGEILGADFLLAQILNKTGVPDPSRNQMANILEHQFGTLALREKMQELLTLHPQKPVGVGDSWSRKTVRGTRFPIALDSKWTLKSREKGVASLEVASVITANKFPVQMGPVQMIYDLTGQQSGTVRIEESTGWPVGGRIVQEVAGTVTTEGAPGASAPTSMAVRIKRSIIMTSR